jgi:hypothetical protein
MNRYRFRDLSTELSGQIYFRELSDTKACAIICQGLPYSPCIEAIVYPLIESGFAAIQIQYSGSFDSGGRFTPLETIQSVGKILQILQKEGGLIDIKSLTPIPLPSNQCIVIGHSFGSWVAYQSCTRFSGLHAGIMVAPYFGFTEKHGVANPKLLSEHLNYVRRAVPLTHRFEDQSQWESLYRGEQITSYSPLGCPLYPILGSEDMNLVENKLSAWIDSRSEPLLHKLKIVEGAGHGLESIASSHAFKDALSEIVSG